MPCDFYYKMRGKNTRDIAEPILTISNGKITYGYKGGFMQGHILLFIDGKLVDWFSYPYSEWKYKRPSEVKKTTSIPPLSPGFHTVSVVYAYYEPKRNIAEDATGVASKQIYVTAPTVGWEVSVDKPTVVAGDILKIRAKVNWKADRSLKFKLGIDAFGKHYESKEVTATTSPTIIEAPITVPQDVKEGKYEIKVVLYYE